MKCTIQLFDGIARAITELGFPKTIWFRGHAIEHKLLPSLYRLSGGMEHEQSMTERFVARTTNSRDKTESHYFSLIAMHHSYVPTRLLAWTTDIHVALFCAFIRETDSPTVFVLDPVALNVHSNIVGLFDLKVNPPGVTRLLREPGPEFWTQHPIAIDGGSGEGTVPARDTIYTLHGKNRVPLEEQCPDCVRKVVLTERERRMARECILSGM